eukprot:m.278147 g.278147  ORF g.278147 m.278147 type:complete len:53 (-) comp54882_c0_seq6:310-468(-)
MILCIGSIRTSIPPLRLIASLLPTPSSSCTQQTSTTTNTSNTSNITNSPNST